MAVAADRTGGQTGRTDRKNRPEEQTGRTDGKTDRMEDEEWKQYFWPADLAHGFAAW